LKEYKITAPNLWNFDEHGISVGRSNTPYVLGPVYKANTVVKTAENREWVSILEAISAASITIPLVVIFKDGAL
jgi:hypothetical protein